MKKKIFYIFFILNLNFTILFALEIQSPFIEDKNIFEIDSKLNNDLLIFNEKDNFIKALLFKKTNIETDSEEYILEIYFSEDNLIKKQRQYLSAEEAINLRSKILDRSNKSGIFNRLEQSGRYQLLTGTTLLSLGYWGWAVPASLDIDDEKYSIATYMLVSATGIIAPIIATKYIKTTEASANLSVYGGTRGIVHGAFLMRLIRGPDTRFENMAGLGVLASLSEMSLGYYLGRDIIKAPGSAELLGVLGDFGIGWGAGASFLIDGFEDGNDRNAAGCVLIGSATGLGLGYFYSQQKSYTVGNAYVLRASGLLGAYIPMAIIDAFNTDNEKIYAGASIAGSVLGLGTAYYYLTNNKSFSTTDGFLITLGEVAGGLIGAGIAYLASNVENDNSTLYLTASSLGALTGFSLSYWLINNKMKDDKKDISWNLRLHPESLFLSENNKTYNYNSTIPPVISFEYTF
ncbi:MAG: hypothetical protein ABIA04_14010 [Pseudomonadota bacterium]